MRSAAAFLVVLFLFGCSQAKQEEAPIVSSSSVEQAVGEVKQEVALVVQKVRKDVLPMVEKAREGIAPMVEELKKEVIPAVRETQEAMRGLSQAAEDALATVEQEVMTARPSVPETATKDGDAVIGAGKWGFSVYDPGTKITKYYTSNGSFLGKR